MTKLQLSDIVGKIKKPRPKYFYNNQKITGLKITEPMGSSTKENIQKFDIAIVGGGPAGLTLAVGLVSIMPELKVCICAR